MRGHVRTYPAARLGSGLTLVDLSAVARREARGFTLVELLVVVAIIVLLVSILTPSMQRARQAARLNVCLSNQGQLARAVSMYTTNNNGKYWLFNHISGDYWYDNIDPYQERIAEVRLCPEAAEPTTGWWGAADKAWRRSGRLGSYGLNLWLTPNDPAPGSGSYYSQFEGAGKATWFWIQQANAGGNTPVLADSPWVGSWPHDFDRFPPNTYRGDSAHAPGYFMGRFCVDRHDFGVGVAFVDSAARRIPLTDLWLLQWCRNFFPHDMEVPQP